MQSILVLQSAKKPTYLYSFEMDPEQKMYGSLMDIYEY